MRGVCGIVLVKGCSFISLRKNQFRYSVSRCCGKPSRFIRFRTMKLNGSLYMCLTGEIPTSRIRCFYGLARNETTATMYRGLLVFRPASKIQLNFPIDPISLCIPRRRTSIFHGGYTSGPFDANIRIEDRRDPLADSARRVSRRRSQSSLFFLPGPKIILSFPPFPPFSLPPAACTGEARDRGLRARCVGRTSQRERAPMIGRKT